jgi:hypothetical protein
MKKLTKKAFVALFALFLAVVALGTTTFAWFTLGNVVSVEEIELNVTGGEGIEFAYVKKDGSGLLSNYVSNMTAEQFLGYLAEDYDVDNFASEFKFDLVTSTDGIEFSKMKVDRNASPVALTLVGADATDIETGVLEFKLRFRTKAVLEQGESKINLVWNHLTLTSDPVKWTPSRNFVNSKGDDVETTDEPLSYYASDAARVSITGNDITVGNDGTVVYENGVSGTNTVMGQNIIFDKGAHNYYYKVAGIDLEDFFGTTGINYKPVATTAGSPDNQVVGTFEEGDPSDEYRYSEITVRVYLDGFDAEAFNSILDSKMKIAFKFTFKKE